MICKNCGGEVFFQNGKGICQNCSTVFVPDGVYENLDVYICYEENDDAGRRTRDSIIAQEVYNKLSASKITTFYERVSADGMIGDDLEMSRFAAICNAKIIIVLGASVESFSAIERKFAEYFGGKPVIPFCVDVNPGAIPKTLSKIQAMSYSTIGWDKDLIKGICNILGREQEVDTGALYDRRKGKIIAISVITAIAMIATGVVVWLNLRPNTANNTNTTKVTEKTLTQNEIYEKAQELLSDGKYLDAAVEFDKIINFKDSSNQIKKIYDRYDGYYSNEKELCSLYINVIDGKTVEFSFEKSVDYKLVKLEESMVLENNQIVGKYRDNMLNEGGISIVFADEYINLSVSTDVTSSEIAFGDINSQFQLKNKTDSPPVKTITKENLLDWVANPISPEEITALGFELEYIDTSGEYNESFGDQYRIANTDVIIIATDLDLAKYNYGTDEVPRLEKVVIIAAIAPAQLLCPQQIGSSSCVFTENDIAYVPTAYDMKGPQIGRYWWDNDLVFMVEEQRIDVSGSPEMSKLQIEKGSKVGIISSKIVGESKYQYLIETHKKWYSLSKG